MYGMELQRLVDQLQLQPEQPGNKQTVYMAEIDVNSLDWETSQNISRFNNKIIPADIFVPDWPRNQVESWLNENIKYQVYVEVHAELEMATNSIKQRLYVIAWIPDRLMEEYKQALTMAKLEI